MIAQPAESSAPDTVWMLVSTALVLLMTPALAFFYGGLVRAKNALNTMMMSVASLGIVGLTWALVAYSLAFGRGSGLIGGLEFLGLENVGLDAKGSIPHLLFMAYQATFAIITAALISGAIVERMRFGPYLAFIALWTLVVYAPAAHWVWGGGWLGSLGVLDYAGGTVVHVNAASAASRRSRCGRVATMGARPSSRTTSRTCYSAPRCSGSDGSVSTPAARSARTRRRPSPS
jgi:ammonium transporter, Amt family